MNRELVAALALLVALVAGCGDATTEDFAGTDDASPTSASPSDPGGGSSAEDDPTEAQQAEVTSISMQRRGGLAGVADQWRLTPGDEFSDKAFELAARRSELEAEAEQLDDEPVCCDFFVYRLTVHYEDGSFNAVVDDDPGATLIWDLVNSVANTSREQPDKPQS
jgi:hypothetical protein